MKHQGTLTTEQDAVRDDTGAPSLLLRPDELAAELRICRTKVYELLASGVLPSLKIGRSVRVPREELVRWIREQTRVGGE